MNLRDLRYIVAVADLGHFGRAAEACRVSQPTLSGQILKLEQMLEVKVFERIGKRVQPTPVGMEILAHARRALAAADEILVAADASRDPMVGELRLGVIPTLAPYLMAHLLPRAARVLPAAPLVLVEEMTRHVMARLREGHLDAALIATQPDGDRLEQRELFDDPFLLAMPASHPLARKQSVRLAAVDPCSLLLLAEGHCLRDQALELCSNARVATAAADVRASSLETLLHLAAAGYGVTLVPSLAWQARDSGGGRLVARPIAEKRARRRVRLVWRRGLPRAAALEALARVIRDSAPRCVLKVAGEHAQAD